MPGRFFILVVPPATQSPLTTGSPSVDAGLRERALANSTQFPACHRDAQNGTVASWDLIPGVGVPGGWPQATDAPAPDANHLCPGESASPFPASTDPLRRIRSTCSE